MTKKKIQIFLPIVAFLLLAGGVWAPCFAQDRKVSRSERRADRNFIRQKFDKAMSQYEAVVRGISVEADQASLHLKTARLYFMLRNYAQSSVHYEKAIDRSSTLLSVDDICNYVDALRFQGFTRKAEGICLNNAYRDIYSRYQRYQNTLDALSMRHSVVPDPGFSVTKLSINTFDSEFWLGVYGDKLFYAKSFSDFNDPGKLFFHRTHYYPLDSGLDPGSKSPKALRYSDFFRNIPADMQNGPLSFSPDLRLMVTTVINYAKTQATVDMVDKATRPFRTQLLYSVLRNNRTRFSKYQPVFDQHPEYSYAHPFLFNDGRSLLFTSDMPGGYGGFDLYVTHFDASSQEWCSPVNLGPSVNTEGDEIFPVLFSDRLIFSSNGLPGFGGYDLFSTYYDTDGVVPGGVYHFPYPVNSVFNDYYMYPSDLHAAYFVSDRDQTSRDDIYSLHTIDELGTGQSKPFYGMSESNAVLGGHLLLNGMVENVVPQSVTLKQSAPRGLLLTLYFDFDSYGLTPESIDRLQQFSVEMQDYQFGELVFDGYADEIGSDQYNYVLSGRRAQTVADYLRHSGITSSFRTEGRGRLKLSAQEVNDELSLYPWSEGNIDWIHVNRRARRVEIYNK